MTDVAFAILSALLGACIGSFLNVCITRWPAGLSVVQPRSRCPRCERPISWQENIPVVSWLALRGKCRGCGLPISVLYPGIELLTAMIWLASAIAFGPTLTMLRVAVFATIMLGISATDLREYVIPDGFTVFGLFFMLVTSVLAVIIRDTGDFARPGDALLGACTAAGAIAIVGWLGEVALKREAMGFGDVTLMAVVGAALGPWRSLLTIFVGAALGAATFLLVVYPIGAMRARKRGETFALPQVPFGVFLAPAAVLVLLWGDRAIAWYLGLL